MAHSRHLHTSELRAFLLSVAIVLILVLPLARAQQRCSSSTPCDPPSLCCSGAGYCGTTDAYCGTGCQNGPCGFATTTQQFCSSSSPCNPPSLCCSQWGWCGSNDSFCGAGCQNGPGSGGSGGKSSVSTGVVVGIVVGAVLLLLGVVLLTVFWYQRRRSAKAAANGGGKDEESAKSGVAAAAAATAAVAPAPAAAGAGIRGHAQCQCYPLADVLWATNNWAEANKIGSGGFGDVFKGVSPHDPSVLWAVKRATVFTTDDFRREVEEMASKNHVNLVRLLGHCSHMDAATGGIEQILIYEYMHNGDLERWVGPGVKVPLTLRQRLDVLIGVAQGLQYLHSFSIVHRDIKPANILLDRNMQAKVADFGLVRISKGTTVGATRVMGTPGYVDPAYSWTQKATPAADVYSFGVVMLSVVTACKGVVYLAGHTAVNSLEDNRMKLTDWVQPLVDAGDADTIKDPRLDAPNHIILRLARFALSCTTMPVTTRPTMARIVSELMAMKEECFGPETDPALENVDRHLESMRVSSLSQELRRASRASEREGASGFSSTMGSIEENGGYR